MGLPVVFHELYSAPTLRHGHRFPMKVFQEIYNLLLAQGVVTPSQIHRPQATLDKEILKLAHSGEYVDRFLGGSLDSHRYVETQTFGGIYSFSISIFFVQYSTNRLWR